MIGTIYIYIPPEDNKAIYRDTPLALALQWIEEDEVHNIEEKELIIMRDGELVITMKQQEEDEDQKSTEKKQRAMTSTPNK